MEAPKLPSIFKHSGPRSFNFKPRYYDERKERLEELKKKYEDGDPRISKEDFRGKLRDKWQSERNNSIRSSNLRLVVIIGALIFITYLILMY